jgi:hypothetical protein
MIAKQGGTANKPFVPAVVMRRWGEGFSFLGKGGVAEGIQFVGMDCIF